MKLLKTIRESFRILIDSFCAQVEELCHPKALKDCDGCRFLVINRWGHRWCCRTILPSTDCPDNGHYLREERHDESTG